MDTVKKVNKVKNKIIKYKNSKNKNMLDTSSDINSDLSYLQSKVDSAFDKIFFHLDENLVGDKQQSRQYLGDLMSAIINNNFDNKEEVLEDLKTLKYGLILAAAVDETDKILNDSSKSQLFIDLKKRLITLKGDVIAGDEIIVEFIQRHSKPYLIKLFEEKKAIFAEQLEAQSSIPQEERGQATKSSPAKEGNPSKNSPKSDEERGSVSGRSGETTPRHNSEFVIEEIVHSISDPIQVSRAVQFIKQAKETQEERDMLKEILEEKLGKEEAKEAMAKKRFEKAGPTTRPLVTSVSTTQSHSQARGDD